MTSNITPLAASAKTLARNPLGIIALFIILIYAFASSIVGFSNQLQMSERLPVIWFLILFPVLVLLVFAWLVSNHHAKLYSPADYREDSAFIEASVQQAEVAAAVREATVRKFKVDMSDEEAASETCAAAGRVAELVTPKVLRSAHLRKILWIDDHHDENVFERKALESLGFTLVLARSTDEALGALARTTFDVIITDMNRAGEPRVGLTLLSRLRSSNITTPYVIYSNPGSTRQQSEIWQRGGLGITNKPDDLVMLVLEGVSAASAA